MDARGEIGHVQRNLCVRSKRNKFISEKERMFIMDTKEHAQRIVDDLLTLPSDRIVEVENVVHFLKGQVQHQGTPLHETGLTREEVFDLRRRLTTFENDWNAPGMDAYDNL